MQQISAGFQSAIANGYTLAVTADVVAPPQASNPGAVLLSGLQVEQGTISVQRNVAQRRTCNLAITPTPATIIPTSPIDTLGPLSGNELHVTSGWYNAATQQTERVSLGVFVITVAVPAVDANGATLTIQGADRSWVVDKRKLRAPYPVPAAGGDLAVELAHLLAVVYPQLPEANISPTGGSISVTPATFRQGTRPWSDIIMKLAAAGGYDVWVDLAGVPTARPVFDPTNTAAGWTFTTGTPTGPASGFLRAARTMTRSNVVNDVFVSSSSPNVTPPVQAEQADNDPGSPTYVGGNLGYIPEFLSLDGVATTGDASAAASNELLVARNNWDTVTLATWPNPIFDVDDVVNVNAPPINLAANYVVDAVTHVMHQAATTQLTLRRVA